MAGGNTKTKEKDAELKKTRGEVGFDSILALGAIGMRDGQTATLGQVNEKLGNGEDFSNLMYGLVNTKLVDGKVSLFRTDTNAVYRSTENGDKALKGSMERLEEYIEKKRVIEDSDVKDVLLAVHRVEGKLTEEAKIAIIKVYLDFLKMTTSK